MGDHSTWVQYKINYKTGKSDDNLSRLPLAVTVKEEPDERALLIKLDSSHMSAAQISYCTDRDPTLAHVREYLTRGWPDEKIVMNMAPCHCRRDEFSVQGGCVVVKIACSRTWQSKVHISLKLFDDIYYKIMASTKQLQVQSMHLMCVIFNIICTPDKNKAAIKQLARG